MLVIDSGAGAAAAAATFIERGKRNTFRRILTLENDMSKIRKTCFLACSNYGGLANILLSVEYVGRMTAIPLRCQPG